MDNEIDPLIRLIRKDHGDEAVLLGDTIIGNVEANSSGVLALDVAMGIGGFPRGRMIEIYGPEGCGKTTLSLHAVAKVQEHGGRAAFLDQEHAFDPEYASAIGVNMKKLIFSQPDYGEQALQIVEKIVKSNLVDIVVVDSVASLIPKAEIDGEIGDHHVGAQARMMSQACRKLAAAVSRTKCVLIFINQIREKIGTIGYGPKTTTPGGRALKFYSSVRIEVKRIGAASIAKTDKEIGNRVRAKIVKNKVAPPFREAEFDIIFGRGVDNTITAIDLAVQVGLIKKKGSSYRYQNNSLGQGKKNVGEYLDKNQDILKKIIDHILEVKIPKKLAKSIENENLITHEEEDVCDPGLPD